MEDRNIVHRDFKLDNVCLSEIGGDCRLVDLGFAWEYGDNNPSRALQAGHNSTLREGRGHMNYRSPENNGETKVDHKDDMWALGVGVCEMATGKIACEIMNGCIAPFYPGYENKLANWLKTVVTIDQELGAIVHGLLLRDPAERFSAKQVIAKLEEIRIRNRVVTKLPPPFLPVGWCEAFLQVQVPSGLKAALMVKTCPLRPPHPPWCEIDLHK
jgi:serine/threonine protein kinase